MLAALLQSGGMGVNAVAGLTGSNPLRTQAGTQPHLWTIAAIALPGIML
jgi:hypothetical protein